MIIRKRGLFGYIIGHMQLLYVCAQLFDCNIAVDVAVAVAIAIAVAVKCILLFLAV